MQSETAAQIDPKRARILEAAAGVFLAYGFQRVTMDDIARAADMSRPALYLQFRNKTDIYRELASAYITRAAEAARRALKGDGPLAPRIVTMFEAGFLAMHEEFAASPHGQEIMDMKGEIAGELIETWRQSMIEGLSQAIAGARGGKGSTAETAFPPKALAEMLIDSFEGAKMRGASTADLRLTVKRLATLAELAV